MSMLILSASETNRAIKSPGCAQKCPFSAQELIGSVKIQRTNVGNQKPHICILGPFEQ